jgi:hypothetical protein
MRRSGELYGLQLLIINVLSQSIAVRWLLNCVNFQLINYSGCSVTGLK